MLQTQISIPPAIMGASRSSASSLTHVNKNLDTYTTCFWCRMAEVELKGPMEVLWLSWDMGKDLWPSLSVLRYLSSGLKRTGLHVTPCSQRSSSPGDQICSCA